MRFKLSLSRIVHQELGLGSECQPSKPPLTKSAYEFVRETAKSWCRTLSLEWALSFYHYVASECERALLLYKPQGCRYCAVIVNLCAQQPSGTLVPALALRARVWSTPPLYPWSLLGTLSLFKMCLWFIPRLRAQLTRALVGCRWALPLFIGG